MAEPHGQLTASARLALRWATIADVARTGLPGDGPNGVPAPDPDSLDLLAGIALAQLRDSPAQALFAHFDLPLGAALSADGPRRYTPDALLHAAEQVPEDPDIPPDGRLGPVIDHARSQLPADPDGFTSLDVLFGALLETTNPASAAIEGLLAARGEDPSAVVASYRDYLGTRTPYADFLAQRHPRRPLELPPFAADEPLSRRRATGTEGVDLVGITAEIDAFAYLAASRTLDPPLAIGLFGDWGSGKSYFLRSLQRRIDEITTPGDRPGPFHTSVAQIEFNAWQYVEGDLWASLLEHLFRNLRTSPDDSDALLEKRHEFWVKQVDENAQAQLAAHDARVALVGQREVAAADVGRRAAERDVALVELERRQRERPLAGWTPSAQLTTLRDEAMARAGLTGVATEAAGLTTELDRSAETLREAGALLTPIRERGWRFVAALVVVLFAAPVIAFLLSRVDPSGVSAVTGGIAWLLATGAGYLKIGNDVLQSGLAKVREAQNQLTAETDAAHTELDGRIVEAEEKLAEVTAALGSAVATEADLQEQAGRLAETLAEITPARVLTEFITERTGSDDYRRRLGIPAVVRRDLERLSQLVAKQDGNATEHAIDRVVLYIDDLDRCPTEVVIKVLEAVHLLLAFPLFVVVVAVDSRWLESSLREHYSQLRDRGASPADYLEKIFQVPFWVRPLEADARRRVVGGLLTPRLRAQESAGAAPGPAAKSPDVSAADRPDFDRVVASFGVTALPERSWTAAADLSVTATELAQMEDLADLLGATPRTLKRFVNVYLLVKAMGRGQGWEVPGDGQVALLLAMSTAMPELTMTLTLDDPAAGALLLPGALRSPASTAPVAIAADDPAGHQRVRLLAWLDRHPHWKKVDMAGLGRWTDPILRFTFARRTD